MYVYICICIYIYIYIYEYEYIYIYIYIYEWYKYNNNSNNLILLSFRQFYKHVLYSCSPFLVISSFHAGGSQVTHILKLFVMFLRLWNRINGAGWRNLSDWSQVSLEGADSAISRQLLKSLFSKITHIYPSENTMWHWRSSDCGVYYFDSYWCFSSKEVTLLYPW